MNLHELAPAEGSRRERRRVGRGHGSGRGKTSGRGTKGQNARSGNSVRRFFEGGQNPWTMKIPHKRGFNRGRFRVETQVVNLRDLEANFSAGETITLASLRELGLIDDVSTRRPVKLLGDGTLTKRLRVEVHAASRSAREAIEAAGGTVTLLSPAREATANGESAEEAAGEAAADDSDVAAGAVTDEERSDSERG